MTVCALLLPYLIQQVMYNLLAFFGGLLTASLIFGLAWRHKRNQLYADLVAQVVLDTESPALGSDQRPDRT